MLWRPCRRPKRHLFSIWREYIDMVILSRNRGKTWWPNSEQYIKTTCTNLVVLYYEYWTSDPLPVRLSMPCLPTIQAQARQEKNRGRNCAAAWRACRRRHVSGRKLELTVAALLLFRSDEYSCPVLPSANGRATRSVMPPRGPRRPSTRQSVTRPPPVRASTRGGSGPLRRAAQQGGGTREAAAAAGRR